MLKKVLTFFVAALLLTGAAAPALATNIASGKCGDNLIWTLDNNGTLTVSGTGSMDTYDFYYTDPPWYKQKDGIKTVVIDGGVTSIGNCSFSSSAVSSLKISEGTKSIRWGAFYYCAKLTNVTIPKSVTEIADEAFDGCTSLTDIFYGGNESQWRAISIGLGNGNLRSSKVTIHYNNASQNSVAVTVNGSAVEWTDASPFINSDGRTMVPLRAVGDALGLSVNWDGAKREAIFSNGSKTIYFPIDSNTAHTSDGRQIVMDTAAIVIDGRTYAPIRYLAEFFGFTVDWDGGSKTVIIKGNGTAQNGNTKPEAIRETPWSAAYKDYLFDKSFLTSGQEYSSEVSYMVALYDMDNDGIPELKIDNGSFGRSTRWAYLYTYSDGSIVYLGIGPTDAFYDSNGSAGIYGYYQASADEIHCTLYSKTGLTINTTDKGWYKASTWPQNLKLIYGDSLERIRDMGWGAFVTKSGF